MAELARAVDSRRKALTGRTPESIEEETGIPTEYMFPEDAKILYIGDPWQRMGRELDESHGSKLTILDYEYGEVASFVDDEGEFMENMRCRSNNLIAELESRLGEDAAEIYGEEDAKWLADFYELVRRAIAISTTAESDEEYALASEAWGDAREHIEKKYKEEVEKQQLGTEPGDAPTEEPYENTDLAELIIDYWYDCVYCECGFKDILDWRNIIRPKLVALEKELQDLSEEDRARIISREKRDLIEERRLKKHTKESIVVEAIFPLLPFRDEAFDIVVASWSISAHVFGELDEDGFEVFWDELHRVLADQGEAFIFPLNYHYRVDETIIDSLERMKEKHPDMDYEILDCEGVPIPNEGADSYGYGDEYTLVLRKKARVVD